MDRRLLVLTGLSRQSHEAFQHAADVPDQVTAFPRRSVPDRHRVSFDGPNAGTVRPAWVDVHQYLPCRDRELQDAAIALALICATNIVNVQAAGRLIRIITDCLSPPSPY